MSRSDELIEYWVKERLWPLALQVVEISVQTPPQTLLSEGLELPLESQTMPFARDDAVRFCQESHLFGVCVWLQKWPSALSILSYTQAIQALIWRDAIERSIARTLAFETNIEGVDNSEFEERFEKSILRWNTWQATNDKVMHLIEELLSELTDAFFD